MFLVHIVVVQKDLSMVQSHYQCLTCKRVVDDCCGSETVQCINPIKNDELVQR